MKKQGLVTGAVILMTANAVSKILGAVFKIPLARIIHEDGMAVFNTAFQVYIMILSFAASGFPFAISKLVAEANARGEKERIRGIVRVSAVILLVLGALGSAALFFGAHFFALAIKEEKAVFAIQAVAPSVFFVALGVVYKGYFQGVSNMIPTAVSQVAEAVAKLAVGYLLAVYLSRFSSSLTAAGAAAGVTAGEIIATAVLFLSFAVMVRGGYTRLGGRENAEIARDILSIAIPLMFASVVSDILNTADTTMVRTRLLDSGLSAEDARFLYGAYTGYALTVFHLPVGILATLGVSVLPIIAGAVSVGNVQKARRTTELALRLTVLISLPCSVMLILFGDEILRLLFNNAASAQMLRLVAPCVVMMCVSQILSAVLQSADKIMLTFFYMLAGSLIKIAADYFLVGMPDINIYGSALSANISNFFIMVCSLIGIKRNLGLKYDAAAIIIKPVTAAAVMTLAAVWLKAPVYAAFGSSFMRLAVLGGVSGAAYMAALFLTNAVSVEEIRKFIR